LDFEAVRKNSRTSACPFLLENVAEVQQEFADVLRIIRQKVPSKFRSLRHVWSFVDTDNDGKLSKKEMRAFFRTFNLPQEESDNLYERMEKGSDGGIMYEQFIGYLGPYVSPDPTALRLDGFKAPKKTKHFDPSMLVRFEGPHAHPRRDHSKTYELDQDPDVRNELKNLMIDIGRKLPLKFPQQRDAFRMLDLQRDGRITRTEMRGFFRGLGWDATVADRLFDMLKEDPYGEVDYKSFMSHFDRILGPQFRQGKRKPLIQVDEPDIEKEVNDIAHILQDRMTTKYKSVKEAFRAVDLNKDGNVCLHEMKTFFRNIGMSYAQAEKVFEAIDTQNTGEIQYKQFIGLFGGQKSKEQLEQEKAQPLWKLYGGAALCL
jgi:Ca2+-binding EF-hand superfamily protein